MPAPYGVTSTGFSAKTLQEIRDELEAELRAEIDPNLNTTSASPIGQFIGIFSSKLREAWELAQAVYSGFYPDSANFAQLDGVASITGTTREAATESTAIVRCNLDGATTLPIASAVSQAGNPTLVFELDEEFTSPAGPAADYDLAFTAINAGPFAANSGTLTVIDTPVAGWNSATNPEDAIEGTNVESDVDLRQRREDELRAIGGSTLEAIRADLLAESTLLDGTTEYPGTAKVTVFENVTDVTDGAGVPPKSFEAVIYDVPAPVADDLIAQRIWESKPAGIQAFGSENGTAVDSTGRDQVQSFSRVTVRDVWLEIDVDVNDDYPATGDADIETAVANYGDTEYEIGDDVISSKLNVPICSVAGIVDITEIRLGFAASPAGTANLVIGVRELADLDTARILVDSTPV
jgi:uncharacterized phage protein gp47/JayE